MRQIKFRAWNSSIAVEKMLHWEFLQSIHIDEVFNIPHLKLMQFTGLTDKNGKEIYEGDILRESDSEKCFVVEYSKEAGAYLMPKWYDEEYVYTIGNCMTDIEIIGNIYENPELLSLNNTKR